MHSSRMRTARSSSRPGGSPPGTPPLGADIRPDQAHTPGSRHPPPPVDRITDACENMTLPQLRCGR